MDISDVHRINPMPHENSVKVARPPHGGPASASAHAEPVEMEATESLTEQAYAQLEELS